MFPLVDEGFLVDPVLGCASLSDGPAFGRSSHACHLFGWDI